MTTTAHLLSVSPPARSARRLLLLFELVVAVNALGGAVYGLAGAEDVPREWLAGTPFESYLVPSLILLTAVGGGMGLAALSLLRHWRYAPEASIVAGALLVVWIATQAVIIVPDGGFSWLQPVMFAAGVIVAALGWRLRQVRRANERRTDGGGG